MALGAAGIDYEHREILLRDKPASMLAVSHKGTVPVLITQDGPIIDESLNIMMWALEQNDPSGWLDAELKPMQDLIMATQVQFKPHLDRYKYASRYDESAVRGTLDLAERAKAENFVSLLENHLTQSAYLFGPAPRLADYAIFPFIRQFANTDRSWWDSANYPNTRAWLETLLVSDVFKTAMQKQPLWTEK